MSQIRILRRQETLNRGSAATVTETEIFNGERFYEVTDDPNPPFEKEYKESQTDVIVYFIVGDPWSKVGDIAELTMMGGQQTGVVYKIIPYLSQSGYTPQNRLYECHIILDN